MGELVYGKFICRQETFIGCRAPGWILRGDRMGGDRTIAPMFHAKPEGYGGLA